MPHTTNPTIKSNPNPTFTPTSTSTTSTPNSKLQNWPLTLRDIKHLYTSHHYRQCIALAEDLLPLTEEPIHKTYLTFYTAISYEGMGLAAHNYSKNKLPLLQAAVEWFVVCGGWVGDASVPSTASVEEEGGAVESDTDSEYGYEDEDKGSDDTLERSIAQLIQGIDLLGGDPFEDDPFIDREDADPNQNEDEEKYEWLLTQDSDAESSSHSDSFQDSPSLGDSDTDSDTDTPNNSFTTTNGPNELFHLPHEQGLIPSPLKVRKASGESFEAKILRLSGLNLDSELNLDQQPFPQYKKHPTEGSSGFVPPLPVRVIPTSTTNPYSDSGISSSGSLHQKHNHHHPQTQPNTTDPKQKEALNFLHAQIKSSITTLHTHINEITALQEARRMSRGLRRSGSFWSFSPVKSSSSPPSSSSMQDIGESIAGGSGRALSLMKETKVQRIERLRGEGWRTAGIRSPRLGWKGEEYYRGFCEGVLDELYLGLRSSG
ncbi:hypothetical protein BO94DRAFT_545472 [Aspergillus sclerotioniger CBS 115572]|uniref:Uncharacterized protein n=1 Tax=Aspergillus sclerotioniger CBS 115572 TaxID=1450535 RepID=A0A317WZ28_9EURO|nr:hypothetical protein BO94DRAFT_545472 [Aspergillus sclerotioniger CBS 115572]PWY89480.1 hypothetical protein BO94DRAFT_545472 [Aspergillus sclerotioniger CBS 115572]